MSGRAALAFTCFTLVALATACSGGESDQTSATATASPPTTYVAIGGGDSLGVGSARPVIEAWPQVFYRTAVEQDTVFVNLGVEGSTVAEALEEQLPLALELRPTLVTVGLNVDDLAAGVPVATYEQQLTELVRALRQDGRARVLVANTLPLEVLPGYQAFDGSDAPPPEELAATVDTYNEAIERVVDTEDAELVDLHTPGVAAVEDGTVTSLLSEDGFHPNTEGHAAIAEVFAAAM